MRRLSKAVRDLIVPVWHRVRFVSYLFRRAQPPHDSRFPYQSPHIDHVFSSTRPVLDIGSGGDPFPHATLLADRYIEPTKHRTDLFRRDGKPLVICDIEQLPFRDGVFEFVMCSHVLEHVENPIMACRELQRVAHAGFIETPTLMKDALFSWADGMHKWHTTQIANRLLFMEYDARRLAGIRSSAFRDLIFGRVFHPLQTAFNENPDLFNTFFSWKDRFEVTVLLLDGTVRELW